MLMRFAPAHDQMFCMFVLARPRVPERLCADTGRCWNKPVGDMAMHVRSGMLRANSPGVAHLHPTCCRYIADKLGCKANGITLSPVQAQRANDITAAEGLADRCKYQVGDALTQPFDDNSFDLVWSLESGEHMPDKRCAPH